ncbi:MAG TPA: STAS domain-containing protein [Gaiellales bacterium]
MEAPRVTARRIKGAGWIVELTGEHDISTCDELRAELDRLDGVGTRVVVDLSRATYIDSSVIAELVRAARRSDGDAGGVFAVVAPWGCPAAVVLGLVDADRRLFPTFESCGAALGLGDEPRRATQAQGRTANGVGPRLGSRGIHYVQVRYPHAEEWIAVDVTEERREAAKAASLVFRELTNSDGLPPNQVRVIDAERLMAEGGQDAINRAAADLWSRVGRRTPGQA